MSKKTIIKCDRCGKIIDDKSDDIYARFSREIEDNQETSTAYDLCPECTAEVTSYIEEYVADNNEDVNVQDDGKMTRYSVEKDIDALVNMADSLQIIPSSSQGVAISNAITLMKRELCVLKNPHSQEAVAISQLKNYMADGGDYKLSKSTIEICIDSIKKDCTNCRRRISAYNRGYADGYED